MKKIALHIFIILFICACKPTKYVAENELLLIQNNIYVDSVKNNTTTLNQYIIQRPNAKALGLPIPLYFYNIGNPKGSKDINDWKKNHHKLYNTAKNIFSEKQSNALANSFVNLNNWFLRNGQAPVTINDSKTLKSEKNLLAYFQNNGYFKSKVWSKKDSIHKKKGSINYYINKGAPLLIDSISTKIASSVLDSIYNLSKSKSFLKINQQYNNQNFVNEAERLTKLFRNNGIYHFNTNAINFMVDTLNRNYKAFVSTTINNRSLEKNDVYISKPYKIQRIKDINIYTDHSYEYQDSITKQNTVYNGLNFRSFGKLRYNPKFLSESIFLKKDQIYTDSLRNLSKSHLRGLKNFKTVSIRYKELSTKELQADIYLTPIEKYTLGIETKLSRSNIRNYDMAAKFSLTNRNTFRGSEIFKISAQGAYFNSENGPGWELGVDASLEIPRLIGFFKLVPKHRFPKTRFFGGTSIQKRIGLDKQNFNVGIDYNWRKGTRKHFQLEFLNTQYVKNFNVKNYFKIYQSEYSKIVEVAKAVNFPVKNLNNYNNTLNFIRQTTLNYELARKNQTAYTTNKNVLNRHNIITSDFLIPTIAFTFTYTTQKKLQDKNFFYLRTRIANSGNIIGYLTSQENIRDKRTIFAIPVAQYFKTDIELKKFWNISRNSTLGIRFFTGGIFTYNESDIPFSRSYFAGGSNDIRAWRTYTLGPGRQNQGLEYNIGSFKLLGNIEYRFDIIGSLKGALFVDAGNIWEITDSQYNKNYSKLNNFNSLSDIAVGSGIGFRYDLKFLVARLDIGLKTKEPYLNKNQWFRNFNLNQAQYNIGINYPF